jgi:hypothetical protein
MERFETSSGSTVVNTSMEESCETVGSSMPRRSTGGKAWRARQAREGHDVASSRHSHRAAGAPPSLVDLRSGPNASILLSLETIEASIRRRAHPSLVSRKTIPMDNHGSMVTPSPSSYWSGNPEEYGDFSTQKLRAFVIPAAASCLLFLNLSQNELWTLPDLSALRSLHTLDIGTCLSLSSVFRLDVLLCPVFCCF